MQGWFHNRADKQSQKQINAMMSLRPWMQRLLDAPPPSDTKLRDKFKVILQDQDALHLAEVKGLYNEIDMYRAQNKLLSAELAKHKKDVAKKPPQENNQ